MRILNDINYNVYINRKNTNLPLSHKNTGVLPGSYNEHTHMCSLRFPAVWVHQLARDHTSTIILAKQQTHLALSHKNTGVLPRSYNEPMHSLRFPALSIALWVYELARDNSSTIMLAKQQTGNRSKRMRLSDVSFYYFYSTTI